MAQGPFLVSFQPLASLVTSTTTDFAPMLPPSSKGPSDDIGLTQITQDHLPAQDL